MLSDWYFCTTLQLPPKQTAIYLDVVTTLRHGLASDDPEDDEVLTEAVTMLTEMGQWRLLHALPLVLAVQHRRPTERRTRAVLDCCTELLDTCVSHRATRARLYELLRRIVERPSTGEPAADIAHQAQTVLGRTRPSPPAAVPYLDLGDFAVPTILLTILSVLSKRDPASVRAGFTGEQQPPWFARALRGEYGRQALLLAVEAATRAGDRDAHEGLTAPGVGVTDMEPDLMACYARAIFRRREQDDAARARLLDELEAAAVTGDRIPAPAAHPRLPDMRQNVYQRLGGAAGAPPVLSSVLWQLTVWELAADEDPADCARRLQRWWGPPPEADEGPFGAEPPVLTVVVPEMKDHAHEHLANLLWLRTQDQKELFQGRESNVKKRKGPRPAWRRPRYEIVHLRGVVSETAPEVGAAICSPWTYRRSGDLSFGTVRPSEFQRKSLFPGLRDPIPLIRLCAAAMLSVRLLRLTPTGARPDAHLMALLMHGKDTLLDHRFRLLVQKLGNAEDLDATLVTHTMVSPHLHGLLLHVQEALDHAGKGSYSRFDPAALAEFLLDKGPNRDARDESTGIQERQLFDSVAIGIAAGWIGEVRSGYGTAIPADRTSARWLATQPLTAPSREPPALRVVSATLDTHTKDEAPFAAALLQEMYPREFEERRRETWDWVARREQIRDRFAKNKAAGKDRAVVLNANAVMCAPAYTVEQWRDVMPEVTQWLAVPDGAEAAGDNREAARAMALVTRLGALLREAAGPDDPAGDWAVAFVDRVEAMVDRQELSRGVRSQMIEWVPVPGQQAPPLFLDEERQPLLGQALTVAVDAITEFSSRAPRYILLLLERLRDTDLPAAMADDLRHRLLRGAFRHRWRTDPRNERSGPLGRVQSRASARNLDRELSRFVKDTAGRRLPHLNATLGEAFITLWHDVHSDPLVRPVAVPFGAEPDAAVRQWLGWRRAVLLDRHSDARIHYPLPVDPERASGRGKLGEPVTSLFIRPAGDGDLAMLTLGVICGVERGVPHGGDDLLVNVGLDGPLRVAADVGADTRVGELRAVRLGRDNAADPWKAHLLRELRPARPVPDERRPAAVTTVPQFPWLRVQIDGEDVYPAGDDERATAIRTLWDPDLSRCFGGPAGEVTAVPARYDGKLAGWVPVERGLTELLATRPGDGLIRLTYAGRDAEDTGEAEGRRMVTAPGHTYLLSAADWSDASRLEEFLATDPVGLTLLTGVDTDTGLLVLPDALGRDERDAPPVDDRNLRWGNLFHLMEQVAERTQDGWVATVEAPAGFPQRIPIDGLPLDTGETGLFFEVTSWNEYERRRGQVRGVPLIAHGLADHDDPSPRRLRWLRDIKRDDELVLEGLIRLSPAGLSTVRGPDGLVLQAETQSLTLRPVGQGHGVPGVQGRRARVLRVYNRTMPRRRATPLNPDELDAALERSGGAAAGEPGVPAHLRTLEGAVVRRLHTRQGGQARVIWGVWLEIDGRVRYGEVADSAFSVAPTGPGIGDLLTARRGSDGWTFEAANRMIRIRAWYRLVAPEEIRESVRDIVGHEIDGYEIVQDRYEPRLAYRRAATADRNRFDRWLAGFRVEPQGKPFGPGRHKDRQGMAAVAESGGERRVLQGFTPAYDTDEQMPSLRGVLLRISEATRGWIEVEREFACELRLRPSSTDSSPQNEVDRFLRWEARGDLLITGAIEPGGLRLGSAARLPDGRYDRLVPRVGEDRQWISRDDEADTYPTERVRALLVPDGDGYRASCRAAPPLPLREFLGELGARVPGRRDDYYRMPPRFRYVGMEADEADVPVHTFEWGHGWRVEVPDERLRRNTRDGRRLELFHGDTVRGAVLREDRGGLEMVVRSTDVLPGLPQRLYAEARRLVVHELEVTADPDAGTVEIRNVLTGTREPASGTSSHHARDLPVSAQLDPESRERLLAELGPGPSRTLRILGRLDKGLSGKEPADQGRGLAFAYIPAVPGRPGEPGLQKGDRLFLLSGRTWPTRDGNDVAMEFLPISANAQLDGRLKVVVTRRYYSHRDDLLVKLHELQKAGEPADAQIMLVTLTQAPEGKVRRWGGETKRSEPRSLRNLVGVLESQHASCLATVVSNDDRKRIVEVRPGVLFDLEDVRLSSDAHAGAVVRLVLGQHRKVTAELAIPSDLGYIPENGRSRPVVVLPKSPLLRDGAFDYVVRRDRQTRNNSPHFTAAGLPGVEIIAPSQVSRSLLRVPHPKTAVVRRTGKRVTVPPESRPPLAGRIEADRAAPHATLVPLAGTEPRAPGSATAEPAPMGIAWARLSFADVGVATIATDCARGTFRYSDATTGHWVRDTASRAGVRLSDTSLVGPRGADEVVFASYQKGAPTLRHAHADLFRFGFPTDHLIDDIVAAQDGRRTYTVAAVSHGAHGARGLWLELRPGHLAELTGEILHDADGRSVSDLRWNRFSPGDRVLLSAAPADPRSVPSIRLERWLPGPRGSFDIDGTRRRVLLPVREASAESGALRLGVGRFELAYPAGPDLQDAFPPGTAVWLNGDNELTGAASPPVRDDVVLIGLRDGDLIVHGLPEARLVFAEAADRLDVCWPDRWLLEAITDRERSRELLGLFGGALAVTVEETAQAPEGTVRITVSRRRQPMGRVPRGSLVWACFLGGLKTGAGMRLILAAGGSLLAADPGVLLPGVPSDLAGTAWEQDDWVWMHADERGRLRAGRPAAKDRDGDITVIPRRSLLAAGGEIGMVCQEEDTSAHRWLPAAQAAWTGLSEAEMEAHLTGRRLRVAVRADETVSLNQATGTRRMFAGLSLGSTVRVDHCGPGAGSAAGHQGLCRIHLSELLVRLSGAEELPGASLLAEVSRCLPGETPDVQVVPLGRRRIIADLPFDTVRAMRRLARWNPVHDSRAEIPPELRRFVRDRTPPADAVLPVTAETADTRVTAIVEAVLGPIGDPRERLLDTTAHEALDNWWDEHGDDILGAAPSDGEIDFAPALAACLLLDARGARDEASARDAVRLVHRLGQYAERSMHVEPLASLWLGRQDRWAKPGTWERLRRLLSPLSGDVHADPREVRSPGAVHDFARSVLERTDPRAPGSDPTPTQSDLAPIARALLAAIGALTDGDHLVDDAPILARMAGLGRGLTPGAGRTTAQPALLDCQRVLLEDLFIQVTRSRCPLVLLPPVGAVGTCGPQ
ncbi:hypothetical protein [Actinomadura sp. 9N407]|uniref:hypothetical protein n=1 Tax=Actinomadura sp. 9N407 TaxID=3375154 RepID=UPI0037973F8E